MIAITIIVLTLFFVLAGIAPLLVADDMQDIVTLTDR
jgi:hypothetical protein